MRIVKSFRKDRRHRRVDLRDYWNLLRVSDPESFVAVNNALKQLPIHHRPEICIVLLQRQIYDFRPPERDRGEQTKKLIFNTAAIFHELFNERK